jgi:hypothetical protein
VRLRDLLRRNSGQRAFGLHRLHLACVVHNEADADGAGELLLDEGEVALGVIQIEAGVADFEDARHAELVADFEVRAVEERDVLAAVLQGERKERERERGV